MASDAVVRPSSRGEKASDQGFILLTEGEKVVWHASNIVDAKEVARLIRRGGGSVTIYKRTKY